MPLQDDEDEFDDEQSDDLGDHHIVVNIADPTEIIERYADEDDGRDGGGDGGEAGAAKGREEDEALLGFDKKSSQTSSSKSKSKSKSKLQSKSNTKKIHVKLDENGNLRSILVPFGGDESHDRAERNSGPPLSLSPLPNSLVFVFALVFGHSLLFE